MAPQVHRVIEPTRIVLYGRYVPGGDSGDGDALEAMTSMNRLNVVVTNLHYDYIFYTYNVHTKWAATLGGASGGDKDADAGKAKMNPEEAAAAAAAKKAAAEEEAKQRALEEKRRKLREKKAAKRREKSGEKAEAVVDPKGKGKKGDVGGADTSGAVALRGGKKDGKGGAGGKSSEADGGSSALAGFKTIFFFRLDEGSLSVPLNWVETDLTMTAPSRIAFSALEVVVEMSPKVSTYMASISNISAKGMDHPSLPMYISLLPRKASMDDASHTLKVLYAMDSSASDDSPVSDVSLSFRNTSLLFQGKQPGITDIAVVVSSLSEWGASLGEYFATHNEEIKLQVTDESTGTTGTVSLGGGGAAAAAAAGAGANGAAAPSGEVEVAVVGEGEGAAAAAVEEPSKPVQDVSYGLDVGEIEVLLFDAPEGGVTDKFGLPPPTATPRSKFMLARVRRDVEASRIQELESMAVQSKLALVESETERERLEEEVQSLRRALEAATKMRSAMEQLGGAGAGGAGAAGTGGLDGIPESGSFRAKFKRSLSTRLGTQYSERHTAATSPAPMPAMQPPSSDQFQRHASSPGPMFHPSMMGMAPPPGYPMPAPYMTPEQQYHMWFAMQQQQQQSSGMGSPSPHYGMTPPPFGYSSGASPIPDHRGGVMSAPRSSTSMRGMSSSDGVSLESGGGSTRDRRRRASAADPVRRKTIEELRYLKANMKLDELTDYLRALPDDEAAEVKAQLWSSKSAKSLKSSSASSHGTPVPTSGQQNKSVKELIAMVDECRLHEVKAYLSSLPEDEAKMLQKAMKGKLSKREPRQ